MLVLVQAEGQLPSPRSMQPCTLGCAGCAQRGCNSSRATQALPRTTPRALSPTSHVHGQGHQVTAPLHTAHSTHAGVRLGAAAADAAPGGVRSTGGHGCTSTGVW